VRKVGKEAMPDKKTWAAAAALIALALCLAVAAASSPALAQAPTRGQLRIQLSYLNGTYWEPWNSTKLTLYGTNSTFTIVLYDETNNRLFAGPFRDVRPDVNGNVTLSVPLITTNYLYNISIYWNFRTAEGRALSFRVFNGTLQATPVKVYRALEAGRPGG
jgi:hypothetical protein